MQIPLLLPLRQDATFENFHSGANASLKEFLAQNSVSRKHALVYLWGEASSGKSHLLQACCHHAFERGLTSVYLPLARRQEFAPEMLEGMENTDVICIDDLNAIESERDWEEAIFHFYNRAQLSNAQVYFSASVPPAELGLSLPDLKTRLTATMVFQLAPPSEDEVVHVLQSYAKNKGLELGQSVAKFLMFRNARDMTSLMKLIDKLDVASLAAQRKLTVPFVKSVLGI